MRIILLQNIKGVGRIGDVKVVSDGYARNFLLPRKLAKPATDDTLKQVEILRSGAASLDMKLKEDAQKLTKILENMIFEIKEDANEDGHLYGSVDSKKIARELQKRKINIDPRQIELGTHIKTVGEHEITLKLHPDVEARLKILVDPN